MLGIGGVGALLAIILVVVGAARFQCMAPDSVEAESPPSPSRTPIAPRFVITKEFSKTPPLAVTMRCKPDGSVTYVFNGKEYAGQAALMAGLEKHAAQIRKSDDGTLLVTLRVEGPVSTGRKLGLKAACEAAGFVILRFTYTQNAQGSDPSEGHK
jgi:hypothetical protein